MAFRPRPVLIDPRLPPWFPSPLDADDRGLVAIGGDLSPDRLRLAYERGIFPWYDEGLPPMWWSPNPRAIISASSLHVSRSLHRELRRTSAQLTWNSAFRQVMEACADRDQGTWILPEMIEAYERLFDQGDAHSIEVWDEGQLVGGLYGVQRGGLFAAESMFHRATNASKVALVAVVQSLSRCGTELIDVQFLTGHLASLGAFEISREAYLERLASAIKQRVDLRSLKPRFEL